MTRRQRGFTLIEVMVAVFVFGVLSAFSYATLNQISSTSFAVSEEMARLQTMQRALQTLEYDLAQINPRPIREALADEVSAALAADGRGEFLLEFTRGGWSNPLAMPRASLQRVAYFLDDDTLVRVQWPVLDRTLGTEPQEIALIDGIEELEFRFLPFNGDWSDTWPARGIASPATVRMRPRAVEVRITLDDYGEIRRVFEVTG